MIRRAALRVACRGCRQAARGRPHERLEADHEVRLGHRRELVQRAIDHQAEQADVAPGPARPDELVDRPGSRIGGRVGVGHVQDRRDPAHDSCQRAADEVLLVGVARIPEVDMTIDDPAHHMTSRRVQAFARGGRR